MSMLASRLLPILLFSLATPSYALDARNPDPLSVVNAAFAAQNVGNVDAATAFYMPDAVITNTRGRRQPSVRAFHESNRDANAQFGVGGDVKVDGNKIISLATTTLSFFDQMGLGPVEVMTLTAVEGNRISFLSPYYPLRAVARIEQGCREHPEVMAFGRPCAEFASGARAHTSRLIADGVAAPE
jgi:hypothetical protein